MKTKELKYPARFGTDFEKDRSGNLVLKTYNQWKLYAERLAKNKTKNENFKWISSTYLNNDPEIHLKSFDYVTISFYHPY